ncbi:MAG: glutamate racemase [candidate division Zixibacteria bacterium]|nr:glutamate racemase [candidate division Zixibacteria bacterium]
MIPSQAKNYQAPIGIFDSGVGGLTVAKRIFQLLPNEDVIYFGDTARYPYGPRSKEIIKKFSAQNINFLLSQKVKFIVVACNTASALALNDLEEHQKIPMIGVIKPGASASVKATKNGRIGVIGTLGTISSGAYQKAIHKIDPQKKVYSVACPLFVALAEEGYINKEATYLIAQGYLEPLIKSKVDTLVLGCTHYPLLKKVISKIMGKEVKLIDSAEKTAMEVKKVLAEKGLLKKANLKTQKSGKTPFRKFFVSDIPDRFVEVGERFLSEGSPAFGGGKDKITEVKRIDIEKY